MRRIFSGTVAMAIVIVAGLVLAVKSDAFPPYDELTQNNVALEVEGFRFASGLKRNSEGRPNGIGFEVVPARWFGSGFIASADGSVVTNYHVASKALNVRAVFDDRSTYAINHIRVYNNTEDLAILKITANRTFNAVQLGNSDEVNPMDRVLAVGNPRGLGINTTEGGVSQVVRDDYRRAQIIRHTATITNGNSGGALYNDTSVIGVNASIIPAAGGGETGFNQAIPINKAKRLLTQYGDRTLPLEAAFPTNLQTILRTKFRSIDGRTAQVSGRDSANNGPGVYPLPFNFGRLQDYIILVKSPNRDLALVVYNSQRELIGFGNIPEEGYEAVILSSQYPTNGFIGVVNNDTQPANFAISIGSIEW
jgi:hypothetical protein